MTDCGTRKSANCSMNSCVSATASGYSRIMSSMTVRYSSRTRPSICALRASAASRSNNTPSRRGRPASASVSLKRNDSIARKRRRSCAEVAPSNARVSSSLFIFWRYCKVTKCLLALLNLSVCLCKHFIIKQQVCNLLIDSLCECSRSNA